MISFKNVSKKFGNKKVLENVNFGIEGQEFVSIIGPNGAGKSTLLHLLIGAEKPDEGEVIVDDFQVHKMHGNTLQNFRRKVGMVFQHDHLLPHKTVEENVAFSLEACGYKEPYIKHRTAEVLDIVGLRDARSRFPRELSGGERQKAAIARALATQPSLFVADEPTGNLDPKSAEEILNLLQKINQNRTTVILATHNKTLVDKIQKRVLSLKDGKIESDHIGGYDKKQ